MLCCCYVSCILLLLKLRDGLVVLRDVLLQDLNLLFVSLDLRFCGDASIMLTAP